MLKTRLLVSTLGLVAACKIADQRYRPLDDAAVDGPAGGDDVAMDAPPARSRAVVVAGDFNQTGVLSTLDVTARMVSQKVGPALAVGVDPVMRHFGTELFIVNRSTGNNITILDAQTLAFKVQIGTGIGSNPQDVAVLGDKLYAPTYNGKGIVVVNRDGTGLREIDLSADDMDGAPNCSTIYLVDGKLYVACQLLNERFKPRDFGRVYVIDAATEQVLPKLTVTLTTRNPLSLFEQIPAGAPHAGELLLPTAEFDDAFNVSDGCIERVTPGSATAPGCLVGNKDLGGFANRIAFQVSKEAAVMWAAVSADAGLGKLRGFDMPTAALWTGSLSPASQVIVDVVPCPTGEVIVTDRTPNANGLRIYLGTAEITTAPLAIGLGQFSSHGLACY